MEQSGAASSLMTLIMLCVLAISSANAYGVPTTFQAPRPAARPAVVMQGHQRHLEQTRFAGPSATVSAAVNGREHLNLTSRKPVLPGGFIFPLLVYGPNNQIAGLKEALVLGQLLNRTVIVHDILNHYRDKPMSEGDPTSMEFSQVFDFEALASYQSIVTLPEAVEQHGWDRQLRALVHFTRALLPQVERMQELMHISSAGARYDLGPKFGCSVWELRNLRKRLQGKRYVGLVAYEDVVENSGHFVSISPNGNTCHDAFVQLCAHMRASPQLVQLAREFIQQRLVPGGGGGASTPAVGQAVGHQGTSGALASAVGQAVGQAVGHQGTSGALAPAVGQADKTGADVQHTERQLQLHLLGSATQRQQQQEQVQRPPQEKDTGPLGPAASRFAAAVAPSGLAKGATGGNAGIYANTAVAPDASSVAEVHSSSIDSHAGEGGNSSGSIGGGSAGSSNGASDSSSSTADISSPWQAHHGYLAVHLRPKPDRCLRLWQAEQYDEAAARRNCTNGRLYREFVPQTLAAMRAHNLTSLFVMVHPDLRARVSQLYGAADVRPVFFDMGALERVMGYSSVSLLAMVEQQVAIEAGAFIGTHLSSITGMVLQERLVHGRPRALTYTFKNTKY